jgi:hypothetical protein
MAARPPPPVPAPALLAAVARMRPVATRRPWREALLVVAAALAATALLVAALRWAAGSPALPWASSPALPWASSSATLWAAGALAALFAARVVAAVVPPAHAVLPRPARPWLKNLATIAAIVALMLQAHPAPEAAAHPHSALWPCLVRGLLAAALPLAIAAAVLRRLVADQTVRRELTGAVVALAGLVLLLTCGNGERAHILGAHGGALLGAPLLVELLTTAARGRAAAR